MKGSREMEKVSQLNEFIGLEEIQVRKTPQLRILVYIGNEILPVEVGDILFAFAENNNRFIATKESIYDVPYTLDQLEKMLGDRYFRINRQFIVPFLMIKKIYFVENNNIKIETDDPYKYTINVSRRKVFGFRKWLESPICILQ
jgi:DNA-binding LytR/AlgR family response regulator